MIYMVAASTVDWPRMFDSALEVLLDDYIRQCQRFSNQNNRRAGLSGRGLHPTLRAWKREWPGECQCTVLLANITQGIPSKSPALIIPKMILGKDVRLPTIVGKPTELQPQSEFMKSELLGCDKGAHPRNDCFWLQVRTSILETQTSDSFTLF